jgi:ABC-2 type transport system permease protein
MPIFDQGYQHWSGHLTGHTWRWYAITRHGVRLGMQNRFIRLLLLFAWLPTVALAAALCIWGLVEQRSTLVQIFVSFLTHMLGPEVMADPKSYRVEIWTLCYEYFLLTELRFSMILILLVGPTLISGDMRFNALPLYFSRPVRRIDYFLGKLGVIGAFLAMVLIIPSLIAFALGLLFSLDFSIVRDTFSLMVASVGYGVIMTLSAGLLILALSSLSRNSRYIALFWLGVWFVSSIVGTVLETVNREQRMSNRYRAAYQMRSAQNANAQPQTAQERQRQFEAQLAAQRKVFDEIERDELEAAKTDWRPLVSYTANLARVGQAMLGSDACWKRMSMNLPENGRGRFLMENMGPQYPWYWSAGVLIVLMGVSACILNFRVKSMDRLK